MLFKQVDLDLNQVRNIDLSRGSDDGRAMAVNQSPFLNTQDYWSANLDNTNVHNNRTRIKAI